jgi:hypothetical protein
MPTMAVWVWEWSAGHEGLSQSVCAGMPCAKRVHYTWVLVTPR